MDPSAKAKGSSAAGMFQFTEQTWLQMVKEEGPKYGLDSQADAITRTPSGRFTVKDPEQKEEILALRYDPQISSVMAGAFTQRNQETMTAALRRPPSDGELYAAHFLGAQGAIDLIRLVSTNPSASAAKAFPDAAAANPTIFYNKGQPRSSSEVLTGLVKKPDGAPAAPSYSSGQTLMAASQAQPLYPTASYANQGPLFNSLFSTDRRPPVSAYVQGIWSGLQAPASASNGAGSVRATNNTGMPLDLSSYRKSGEQQTGNQTTKGV